MYGLVIAVALASPAQPGDANKYLDRTKLDERLDLLADQIADVLTSRKAGELKVADVVCATDADDPHAAWLQRDMTVRFERRKVKVADVAAYTLRLEYGFEKRAGMVTEVYIQATLALGKDKVALPKLDRISSDDMRDKLRLVGVCVSLAPDDSKEQRDDSLSAARKTPSVHVGGMFKGRVYAAKDSPYAVELVAGPRDKNGPFRERVATVKGGVAFAGLEKDEAYRVRIVNESKSEAACRVYIDGIDAFEFSDDRAPTGEPKYKHVLVPAGKTVEVPGWHKSAAAGRADNWKAFVVTEFGQGAASRVAPKGPVGTIKVVFAESYDPADQKVQGRSAGMETGMGRDIGGPQRVLTRKIEPPAACVVIRYTREAEPGK